jgi:hypothetical protein
MLSEVLLFYGITGIGANASVHAYADLRHATSVHDPAYLHACMQHAVAV